MASVRKPPFGGESPADSSGADRSGELAPRKLIRPALSDLRREPAGTGRTAGRKAGGVEQTNAEAFYYLKQMQARTAMVVRLLDGEELRGWIEWYDRDVIKLNRDGAPNLVIPKHAIKYLFKEEEERLHRRRARHERRVSTGTGSGEPRS